MVMLFSTAPVRRLCVEIGLPPSMTEVVDLHHFSSGDGDLAAALSAVEMAVNRLRMRGPKLNPARMVAKTALVVGGGPALPPPGRWPSTGSRSPWWKTKAPSAENSPVSTTLSYGRCEHGLTHGHQHRETHPPSSPPGKGGYGHRGAWLLHQRLYWMAASEPLRLLKKSRTISERESRFASPQASAHSMASRYSAEVMPRQISGYSNAL